MSKLFEIHITGSKDILNFCRDNYLKSLELDLLDKNLKVIKTEYMTSIVRKYQNFPLCKEATLNLAEKIKMAGIRVDRIKIESPLVSSYVPHALYIETHFYERAPFKYPASRNITKSHAILTDREYNNRLFEKFMDKHYEVDENREFELCLYDDNMKEDKEWFESWQ